MAITAVIFINAVSVAISLLMVTAIGLPLLSEPKKRTRCASFNLYLLFLSTGDVIISTGGVYMWQSFYGIEWKGTEDLQHTLLMTLSYVNENILERFLIINNVTVATMTWLVAFICNEILKLLRNSKQRKKCKPPTLRTATLHLLMGCAVGTMNGVQVFFLLEFKFSAIIALVIMFIPILYSLWVVVLVVKEGLLRPGVNVGNRLSVLVFYFFRLIAVYCILLGSGAITAVWAVYAEWNNVGVMYYVMTIVWGVQGWVSFAVIVSKPDVGRMVLDLLVCRLCRFTPPTAGNVQTITGADDEFSRLAPEDQVSRQFINGIVDYLSEDEGEVDVEGRGNEEGNRNANEEGDGSEAG